MKTNKLMSAVGLLMLIAALGAGCSRDSATQPSIGDAVLYAVSEEDGQVQFAAQVQTKDEAQRKLTFKERPEIVIAYENCVVVRLRSGQEEPASFGEICPGDTLQVYGERRQSSYVYAYRLRIQYEVPANYQFAARVQTTEQNRMRITFQGKPDTVIAVQNCEFARQCFGFQFQVGFSDIKPGDSLQVGGERHQDGYMYAHQIKICADDPGGRWDVSFKDTIMTIDYAQGTFTVAGRSEVITTDEDTRIRGVIVTYHEPADNGRIGGGGTAQGEPSQWGKTYTDTVLAFTDLAVGDVVTVHAVFVDETTLLATCISLVDCQEINKKCVEFTDQIATIDAGTRLVTFVGQTWIGDVCNGAQLLGLLGEELTLADFASGETVAVKGFPVDDVTLRISRMEKVTTP